MGFFKNKSNSGLTIEDYERLKKNRDKALGWADEAREPKALQDAMSALKSVLDVMAMTKVDDGNGPVNPFDAAKEIKNASVRGSKLEQVPDVDEVDDSLGEDS